MATPVTNTNVRNSEDSRNLAKLLIDRYYRTTEYPYTNHHIASYDQFIYKDLLAIIKGQNPIVILKDILDEKKGIYRYKAEIFIGGQDGNNVYIGAPTISLQNGNEVRLLFPNEARLRNLTYASNVYADISVKITLNTVVDNQLVEPPQHMDINYEQFPLCQLPIMLHSSYCLLNGKPKAFLEEVGECYNDHGGYFIIDGSEKVLITSQEQAFNTLYISNKPRDAKVSVYANIYCLSPKTRQVKMVSFSLLRERFRPPVKGEDEKRTYQGETIMISLPMVRKPIPLFVLFRAMGIQTDEDIVNIIFPDKDGAEAELLRDKLIPSILEAAPFMNKYTAVRYIKVLTKGYSVQHVLDVIRNQMFIHVDDNIPGARVSFLGDCVRGILRVAAGIDPATDKDDIRNQRCLTSGFLTQMLFFGGYRRWIKSISLAISSEYNYNKTLYEGENFKYLFSPGNFNSLFRAGQITEDLMKGFKGKWGGGLGEEKAGVLQALSRLSYLDFMSHCRRIVSDFDTSLKLTGPRHLHTSQYGYFCTNETPGGASIGITKNLSVMTQISTSITNLDDFVKWVRTKGGVLTPNEISMDLKVIMTPVYINGGIVGYTSKPQGLLTVLRLMKHTGFLPYSTSVTFNFRTKRLLIYVDEGRPLRPLIILDNGKLDKNRIVSLPTWRDLIIGTHPERRHVTLKSSEFNDPLVSKPAAQIEEYIAELGSYRCAIEYVDPYEHNETFIANFESHIQKGETTHLEIHPSTMLSILTSLIPFPNHNQSPRNQLSDSQSKQGVSLYATNWKNRYDNNAHVLCYGETPLSRTIYTDYLGEGKMPYGQNIVVAIAAYTGYNQEDGIVINKDALDRGLFRTSAYKSYEAFEEDDSMSRTTIRFGNPAEISEWMNLRPGLDYSKLDKDGFIKIGEYVDENTVIVGAYMIGPDGEYRDASVSPQVWTYGRVESLVTTVNNIGLRLTKVRVVQDRIPVLGDKFSNRHGQKGTIGMIVRGCDMPRTINGVIPDIIMNPHCIPSRMTMGQILEQLLGKLVSRVGALGDATAFMNEGSPVDMIGNLLEGLGVERYGNEILYNGMTGKQTDSYIFVGQLYSMRLKHMVEDKWQARGKGRREQKTHQPTGGRCNQGGLKIGEQERDSISCHGAAMFLRESFMERSDGTEFPICIGCGTIPIYNPKLNIAICSLCDGPVKFSGNTANNLEIIPPSKKPTADIVKVEVPYSFKLLNQELGTFMNMFMRVITTRGVDKIRGVNIDKVAGMVEIKDLQDINERYIPELPVSKPQEKSEEAPPVEELESMANSINMTLVPKSQLPEVLQTGTLVFDRVGDEGDNEVAIGAEAEGLEGPIDEEDFEEFDIRDPTGTMGMSFGANAQQRLPNTAIMGTQYPFIPARPPMPPQGIVPAQAMQQFPGASPSAGPTLVVDTSPNAMAATGLPSIEQTQSSINTINMGGGGYIGGGGYMQQPQRQRAPRRRQPRWGSGGEEYSQPGGYMPQQQQQQQAYQPSYAPQQQQQQQQREYAGIGQGYSGPVTVKKSE